MGTRARVDDGPAYFSIKIPRGDDVSRVWEFLTDIAGVDGATEDVPLDITGRTYASSISVTLGGTPVVTPTCTVPVGTDGKVTWAFTDTSTDNMTAPRYVFDVIENPGTTSERTVILGDILMTGRATP